MLNHLPDRLISVSASCVTILLLEWLAGWLSVTMLRHFVGKLKNRQIQSVFRPVLYEMPQEIVYSHMHNIKVKVK
jgi:hypothetical protein